MNLSGGSVRLRAVEPGDVEAMYRWENDPAVWRVSGTLAPFSRHQLTRFVEEQQFDLFQTRQQRLIIELSSTGEAVGTADLFEIDPLNRRAGVGILIHDPAQRGRGYAADAVEVLCRYAREVLGLHQLWCQADAGNTASLRLFRAAGFTACGTRREWNWTPDGYRDEVMMQKLLE